MVLLVVQRRENSRDTRGAQPDKSRAVIPMYIGFDNTKRVQLNVTALLIWWRRGELNQRYNMLIVLDILFRISIFDLKLDFPILLAIRSNIY